MPQVIEPCRHTFCKECVDTLFDMAAAPKCPMCRRVFGRQTVRDHPELATQIQSAHSEEYAARKRDYELVDRDPVVFMIHNTAVKGSGNYVNWKLFVKSVNNDEEKYIDRVLVHLHPTFNPSVYTLRNKPFQLSCKGWGVFGIQVIIHWREKYQRTSDEYTYPLTFHPSESNQFRISKRFNQRVQPAISH